MRAQVNRHGQGSGGQEAPCLEQQRQEDAYDRDDAETSRPSIDVVGLLLLAAGIVLLIRSGLAGVIRSRVSRTTREERA